MTCPSPFRNGENGLSDLLRVAHRLDDALDPAAVVLVDLVRLPALGGAAERVADGGAGEAADGTVGQLVSVHVDLSSVEMVARPAGREAGPSDWPVVPSR